VSYGSFRPGTDPFTTAARQALVSNFDPALPPVPLETWLTSVVEPATKRLSVPRVTWLIEFCDSDEASWYPGDSVDQTYWPAGSKARQRERAFCAIALSEQSKNRLLYVLIQVAIVTESSGTWRLVAPRFYGAHITGSWNLLTVETLGSIPDEIRRDEDTWPKVDLVVLPQDVSVVPAQPKRGDLVTVSITFTNVGAADAEYAHGILAACAALACKAPNNILQDVDGRIPVGETLSIQRAIRLRDGAADVAVCMEIWPPNGAANGLKTMLMQDHTPDDNCVGLEIRPQGVRRVH
jgi:hypothetical protein